MELRGLVGPEKLGELLEVYNGALRQIFYLATCLVEVTVLGAAALEWKSVKQPEGKVEVELETKQSVVEKRSVVSRL